MSVTEQVLSIHGGTLWQVACYVIPKSERKLSPCFRVDHMKRPNVEHPWVRVRQFANRDKIPKGCIIGEVDYGRRAVKSAGGSSGCTIQDVETRGGEQ